MASENTPKSENNLTAHFHKKTEIKNIKKDFKIKTKKHGHKKS